MMINTLPQQSFIHTLDIRTKALGFLGILIMLFLFNNPLYDLILAVLVCALAISAKLSMKKISHQLLPLIPMFLLVVIFSGFATQQFKNPFNQTVLFYLLPQERLAFTIGGLLQGITFMIRLVAMVIVSTLFTITTPVDDLLQLLTKLKVPYEFSFIIITAIRFIPTLNKKRLHILEAQKARGAQLEKQGIISSIRNSIPIMVTMIINSLIMANDLAKSMLNRGYGYTNHRTVLKKIAFQPRDYLIIFLNSTLVSLCLYLRFSLELGIL